MGRTSSGSSQIMATNPIMQTIEDLRHALLTPQAPWTELVVTGHLAAVNQYGALDVPWVAPLPFLAVAHGGDLRRAHLPVSRPQLRGEPLTVTIEISPSGWRTSPSDSASRWIEAPPSSTGSPTGGALQGTAPWRRCWTSASRCGPASSSASSATTARARAPCSRSSLASTGRTRERSPSRARCHPSSSWVSASTPS